MRKISGLLLILAVSLILFGCELFGFGTKYGSEVPITILNAGFESPDNGDLDTVDNWSLDGSWQGRFRNADVVVEGEYAAWSCIYVNGGQGTQETDPDNGLSQELANEFEVGRYTLTVKAFGNNTAGLTSRLILGYDSGDNTYVELKHRDTPVSSNPDAAGFTYAGAWITQQVIVEIKEKSPAIGKPIWLRLTSTTPPSGSGGNSCWWDDVTLTIAKPVE